MSYCLHPDCPQPSNPDDVRNCQACGTGLLLRDRYRIGSLLGQGGFGATFLATDTALPGEPSCVVKQLRPSATAPSFLAMARELFEREAQTLGRLGSHPQVPRLLDYFEDAQHFYLVQDYIGGHNLQEEIKRRGPFTEAGLRQFLSEVLPILQFIHAQQVIHRDIKPANLIRRDLDCKLVLIDFGAVKTQVNAAMAASTSEHTALTSFAVGTPGYAPAEQMAMRPVYASDIYSLGVTCIYLLTGKNPKDLGYDPATGNLKWEENVDISASLATVLRKMLEIAVRDRYQSADSVLRALELEPYHDSLASGLVGQPGGRGSDNDSGASNTNSGHSQYISPRTLKLAQTIREQRARREQNGDGATGPRTSVSTPSIQSGHTWSGGMASIRKLTAKEVLDAYKRGDRDFSERHLTNLDLQLANLAQAVFHESKLSRTNLRRANLLRTDFGKADLQNAILREANLNSAYLSYANLENADLRGADLTLANFNQANMQGANLCGANLTNAMISNAQLDQAKTNWATTRPDGKRAIW